ncbi:MAG: phage tail spike protein [Schleiferilactobacillus perolens]|uniref:phage tail spike protein n=1 Tax=Schleiferilactobacillus perolens TaxID=100468 RepID=UPI0039EA4764
MRLYVQDRAGNTLDVIDKIYDDKHSMILASGVSTYDFTTLVIGNNAANLKEGNIVILTDRTGQGWAFTIMTLDRTNLEITCHCEDLGLELLNKNRDAWASPGTAQPFTYYFDKALSGTGWEIGINEAADLTRTLSWEGRTTALARLLSIATQFDNMELEFRVDFRNLTITKKIINVYKHRGMDRGDVQLVYGDRVSDIKQTSDLTNFHTALQGIGSQIESDDAAAPATYVDFSSIEYDDGEYFSPKGDPMVYARTANQRFNIANTYLEDFYEYDTSSPQELFNRTLTQLKKQSEVALNYDISLTEIDPALDLGDTVTILDQDFNPPLYLSARMLEIDRSYSDPSQDMATFGNFLILHDNISDQLRDLQDKVGKVQSGKTPFAWVRYADDDKGTNMSALATGKAYMAIVWNYDSAVPSDDPNDYAGHWVKVKGDPGDTGQPGPTGLDGKTSYLHIAWADSADGKTNFSTNEGGERAYIGTYSDFTEADSTSPTDYTWQLNKGAKGAVGIQGPATFIASATAPENPIKGFIWMQPDASGHLAAAHQWDGSQWVETSIAGDLIVDVLTGKIINGGEFHTNNEWDDPNAPGQKVTNTQDITKAGYTSETRRSQFGTDIVVRSDIDNYGAISVGYTNADEFDKNNPWANTVGRIMIDPITLEINFQGLGLTGDYFLSIQDAYQNDMAPSSFTYFNGYGPSSDTASDPNNGHLFRFGRTVVLNTYFKRKNGTNNGAYTDFFQLPAWARPAQTAFVYLVLAQGFATYAGQGYVYNTGKVHSGAIGGGVGKDGGEYQVFGVWQGVDITS